MGIMEDYQEQTKYDRKTLTPGVNWNDRVSPYKVYENPIECVELKHTTEGKTVDFWKILNSRRSGRKYSTEELSFENLSLLFWSMNGISMKTENFDYRTSPSAGALYPVETYLVANRVENLEPGIYHHNVKDNKLEFIRDGYFGEELAHAALGQKICERSAAVFVWTAIPARSKWKYKERALRYIYLDAGHIAQNLHLAAEALGLGACMIGAFFDSEINNILSVDGENETVIYMASVGNV